MMPIRRIHRSLSRVALIWRSSNLKDPRSLSYRYASWSRPTVKSSQRTSLCLKYLSFGSDEGEDERSWRDIETAEFVQIVQGSSKKETNILIVDVREPEELVEGGLIPGSVNIPLGDVEEALSAESDDFKEIYSIPKPSSDTDVVFYCRAGVRSLVAIEIANKLGYSKCRHYVRGYLGWEEHIESDL